MTQAQQDAYLCGVTLDGHDAQFVAQHRAAYMFAKPYVLGKRVLEVGFGSGFGTAYLAEFASEIVGIDMAPGNIPRAAEAYPRPNLTFRQMDATHLDFPDASFDCVCSFQVIEHIPEPLLGAYLTEIRRVLAETGVYCVSTLNLAHNMKPGHPYQKLVYHEKEFRPHELDELLRRVFPVVELYGLHRTATHRVFLRLKKWGLDRVGPPQLNPIARFYEHASTDDFLVSRRVRDCLDLLAICRLS